MRSLRNHRSAVNNYAKSLSRRVAALFTADWVNVEILIFFLERMSLVASLVEGLPRALAATAAIVAPFCAQRERILIGRKGAAPTEHVRWSFVVPLGGNADSKIRKFNRIVYDAISEYHVAPKDAATAAPVVVVRENATPWPLTLFGAATSARATFVVPYGAIDGADKVEYGEGGLMAAYERDVWFYNRLCRYRE